jgi:hypothetical protein
MRPAADHRIGTDEEQDRQIAQALGRFKEQRGRYDELRNL